MFLDTLDVECWGPGWDDDPSHWPCTGDIRRSDQDPDLLRSRAERSKKHQGRHQGILHFIGEKIWLEIEFSTRRWKCIHGDSWYHITSLGNETAMSVIRAELRICPHSQPGLIRYLLSIPRYLVFQRLISCEAKSPCLYHNERRNFLISWDSSRQHLAGASLDKHYHFSHLSSGILLSVVMAILNTRTEDETQSVQLAI